MPNQKSTAPQSPSLIDSVSKLSKEQQDLIYSQIKEIKRAERAPKGRRLRAVKGKPLGSPVGAGKPAKSFKRNWWLWSIVWVQAIVTAAAEKNRVNHARAIRTIASRGLFEGSARLLSNGTLSKSSISMDQKSETGRISEAALKAAFYEVERLFLEGPPRHPDGTPKLPYSGEAWLDLAVFGKAGPFPDDLKDGLANAAASVFANDLLNTQDSQPRPFSIRVAPDADTLQSAASLIASKPWKLTLVERAALASAQTAPMRPWGYLTVWYRPSPVERPHSWHSLDFVEGFIAPMLDIRRWRFKAGHPGEKIDW